MGSKEHLHSFYGMVGTYGIHGWHEAQKKGTDEHKAQGCNNCNYLVVEWAVVIVLQSLEKSVSNVGQPLSFLSAQWGVSPPPSWRITTGDRADPKPRIFRLHGSGQWLWVATFAEKKKKRKKESDSM